MKGNPVLNKSLVVGVIVLFIGVGVQPAFAIVEPETIDANYYDVNVEFCGLGKNHSVQLTQQQLDELELIFETLREQLNNTESKEEIIQIYNNAIERLDDIGVLGDYSVKEVQELVTGRFQRPIFNILVDRLFDKINYDNNTNTFCQISGRTSNTGFLIPWHTVRLYFLSGAFQFFILRFRVFLQFLSPLIVGSICLGYCVVDYDTYERTYYPASGWVETSGLNGKKEWNGSFIGKIFNFEIYILAILLDWAYFSVGVIGFTGIKINKNFPDSSLYYYLGSAIYVKIDYK